MQLAHRGGTWSTLGLPLGSVWMKAGFGAQLSLFHTQPDLAETANKCDGICGSKHVAQEWSQVVKDIDLHQIPEQENPEQKHLVTGFRLHQNKIQLASQMIYPKGDVGKQKTLLREISCRVVTTNTAPHTLWSRAIFTVSNTHGPRTIKTQLQEESQCNSHRDILVAISVGNQGDSTTGFYRTHTT